MISMCYKGLYHSPNFEVNFRFSSWKLNQVPSTGQKLNFQFQPQNEFWLAKNKKIKKKAGWDAMIYKP
jgi:hypothetical protein